jgi:hypothetical protein
MKNHQPIPLSHTKLSIFLFSWLLPPVQADSSGLAGKAYG